ncbi:MAG: GNAT family N-acetyltransferase [Alphaproteobacteria bacterium]|nr:GNAT family N-acetyltransferase [Alphaproteobacteria bacterium]
MPEITLATRKNYDFLTNLQPNDWEDIFASMERGERDLYIISESDQICGYVTLNYAPKYTLYKRLSIPEIQDLYIAPEFRRQGLADKLITHCENTAKQRGADQIGISVSVSPQFAVAQRLYIARGYNVDGNGATYDRIPVEHGKSYKVDDDLCLMLIKDL